MYYESTHIYKTIFSIHEFYGIFEEKKMLYIQFVNLRYAIHTTTLKPLIRLLADSCGLNIFKYYRIWRRMMLGRKGMQLMIWNKSIEEKKNIIILK